ncbi:MAG TPA: O-methyltransferase [Longimicrobiaceae bacterium]|nr:O-methyltransferase [Longimicrobiaceae bacterium]
MDREAYLEGLLDEDAVLRGVRERSEAGGLPPISVAPGYGRLLTVLVRACRAREVLEVGALGGYSGICLARGLGPDGRLMSLEVEEAYARVAAESLRAAGLGDRVEYRVGPALESMRALEGEGRRFDFFFIDADKESYPGYLELALRLARPGALVAADNALWHDRVLDPGNVSAPAEAMRRFNRELSRHPRLTAVVLPAYDGLALAVVDG